MLESYHPQWIEEPPHPPQYDDSLEMRPNLREVLRNRGITRFYDHQTKAIQLIRQGKDLVLMAPTAAGKTECYMVPVVEAAMAGKCSLLLFPTKALSRDQWNRIREFNLLGVRSAVYDGDTPTAQRTKIRGDFPHVIITNVDMLHFMLLNSRLWKPFFSRLQYVVVDEMHAYSGTLGSHVSNVLWRLQRLIKYIRANPHALAKKVKIKEPDEKKNNKQNSKKPKFDPSQRRLFELDLDENSAHASLGATSSSLPISSSPLSAFKTADSLMAAAKSESAQIKTDEEIDIDPAAMHTQFICSSATIGNALEFAELLTGRKHFELVQGTGAPRGLIHHAVISESEESVITTCLKLAKELEKKTLIFGNSHNMVERLGLIAEKMDLPLAVYRSGLPPDQRRDLEASFHSGRTKILAATSALELGMDVGDADAAILAGFPGTVTRLRQRIGRVGRKGQDSYAILVARDNPLDQYYASNPNVYLLGKAENCHAKPDNPHVRLWHLLSAARDAPLDDAELNESDKALCAKLVEEQFLRTWAGRYSTTVAGIRKAQTLSLRNAGKRVRIIDAETGKQVGEREASIAIGELYPGAIYLIGGRRYRSQSLDLDEQVAHVTRIHGDEPYFTQSLRKKTASILDTESESQWGAVPMARGPVHISNEVYGYMLKDSFTSQVIARHELDEPLIHEFDTSAFWTDWSFSNAGNALFADGLHALEHVSIAMMPALCGADPAEIGGISYPDGRIFYYEGSEGGSGLSKMVMPRYGECIQMSADRLAACPCESGCPRCIFSPQCGNNNKFLDKEEAKKLAAKGLEAEKNE